VIFDPAIVMIFDPVVNLDHVAPDKAKFFLYQ
jgi:hypothetical protein